MRRIAALVAAVALGLTACGGSEGGGDKAGAEEERVTLRIGTDDDQGRPGADAIREFAGQVEELSEGKIVIEPVWKAAGEGVRNWDQRVARMVVAGDLDMGMIPARAWDTEGVTSLRALHAPFLVDSNALVEEIVTSDLAEEMLSGLDRAGVVGLALLPENLRHPFSFEQPLLSPEDYAGKGFRAPRSDVVYATLEALGARPDDLNGDEFQTAITRGQVAGAESAFALAQYLPLPPIATGNVTLFPKVNSLVIGSDVFESLTDDQRAILDEAAGRALDQVVGNTTSDRDAAKEYCQLGGGVVLASAADLAALEVAVEPVYAQLEQDGETKSLIAEMRALKQRLPDANDTPEECEMALGGSHDVVTAKGDQSVLDGVYRFETTAADLRSHGVTNLDDIAINRGVYTWTLEDGGFSFDQRAPDYFDHQEGTYAVDGDRVTFFLSWIFDQPGAIENKGLPVTFVWQGGDHSLDLKPVGATGGPIIEATFTAHSWTKIE